MSLNYAQQLILKIINLNKPPKSMQNIKIFFYSSWKANEASHEKHIATVSITHAVEVFHKMRFGTMDVKAIQIGPAYVQLHLYTMFGLVVILQTTCPVEPLMQKVIHRFYGPPGTGPFMKLAIYAESVMVS